MQSQDRLTKSEKIRKLYDAGLTVAEIAQLMGIRYQFAYNVISYYVQQKKLEVLKNGIAGDSDNRSIYLEYHQAVTG